MQTDKRTKKSDHTQDDTYIALTEKGHLGHLQLTMGQFYFMSTLDHRTTD